MPPIADLSQLCLQVQDLCKKAGAFVRKESYSFSKSQAKYKSRNDLVSYVDLESERMLIDGLRGLLPGCHFLSEETHQNTEERDLVWVIDPLDGTTNFIHSVPHFCISVALMQANEVVLGVVYEVNKDQCFHSVKGGQAYLNNEAIEASETSTIGEALVATGFSVKDFGQLEQNMQRLAYFIKHSHGVRRLGTAALDLCYVACGIFDAFYETDLSAWDVAGASIIATNAGCKVDSFKGDGNYIFGRQIMASNPLLFNLLNEKINSPYPIKDSLKHD